MFKHIQQVFLSSGNIIFPSLSTVNHFTNNHKVSALFPAFSGYSLPLSSFHYTNDNLLYVNLPSISAQGSVDIILYNAAGYSLLSKNGYTISYNLIAGR
jgi:hypothetical protein